MNYPRFAIKLKFYKHGPMRFFSQLDLVRVLERALRRTNLALYFTKGFNPHVKISFSDALKLGVEGEVCVIFYFTKNISTRVLKAKISPQLPLGLEITEINKA